MTIIKISLLVLLGMVLMLGFLIWFQIEFHTLGLDPTMYPYPTHLWPDGKFSVVIIKDETGYDMRGFHGCLPWMRCDDGYADRGIFRPREDSDG